MLRKTILAFTTIAALGAVALAPTGASAHGFGLGFGHHPHGMWGWRYFPTYVASDCYWVKKYTPFGVRLIKVCNY